MAGTDILAALTEVLKARRDADPEASYVAELYAKGLNRILEKVGEEATETVLAAKDLDGHGAEASEAARDALVHEVADLWFHTLVMLVHLKVDPSDVLATLEGRFGLSGHEEKRSRQTP